MGSAEMSGNGNKGMEMAHEAQLRVALVRVGAVVGDIFGNNGGKRQGYGRNWGKRVWVGAMQW